MLKQAVALLMASLLAVPVWAISTPLGFVDSSKNATLSGTHVAAGATVFDSDGVQVLSGGSLSVSLTGGSRATFAPNTDATFARDGGQVVVNLQRGVALLMTTAKSSVEAVVANVSFRPKVPNRPSTGWLELKGSQVVLYANRGDWLVNIGHDGKSVLLRQGNRLQGSLTTAGQGVNVDPHKSHKKKLAAFLISAGLGGLAAGLAIGLEPTAFVDCVDPVQPTVCGPPVASPVAP